MCSKCLPPERVHASERLLRTRPTFSETVMVSVGVSKLSWTEFFYRAGGGNKWCLLLRRAADVEVIAVIRQMSANEFVFQQDSAPAHHAELVRLLSSYVVRRARLYFTGTVATEQSRS